MLIPAFMVTPFWPKMLEGLERVFTGWFVASLGGEVGHRERLEDAEIDASGCGGPLAQADFCGSWVGIFGVDVFEGVLIVQLNKVRTKGSIVLATRRGGGCTGE